MLNKSGKSGYPYFVYDLGGNAFRFWPHKEIGKKENQQRIQNKNSHLEINLVKQKMKTKLQRKSKQITKKWRKQNTHIKINLKNKEWKQEKKSPKQQKIKIEKQKINKNKKLKNWKQQYQQLKKTKQGNKTKW